MNKYVFTFGFSQLKRFNINTTPLSVALVVEAESHSEARHIVWLSPIGLQFSSSYTYESYLEQFRPWLNQMVNYTLDQLLATYNTKSEPRYIVRISEGDSHKETTIYAPNRETALQRATAILK